MCNRKEHFCGVLHCNKITANLLLTNSSLGTYAVSIELMAFAHVLDSIWLLFEFFQVPTGDLLNICCFKRI